MNIAMFRVGIDTGSGGIHGPIFSDGEFEFIPIAGKDIKYTYGNMDGRHGDKLINFFPKKMQGKNKNTQVHHDPEFTTFTYGDPNKGKQKLAHKLKKGDLVVFYAGLEGWGEYAKKPAMYIIGYFIIEIATLASNHHEFYIQKYFKNNAHVYNTDRFEADKQTLVLLNGNKNTSRLLNQAYCISCKRKNKADQLEDCLSPEMQEIFGSWGRISSLKRNSTHWIPSEFTKKAFSFITSLN